MRTSEKLGKRDYPILEFDPTKKAVIEPKKVLKALDVPEHCVICFFHDVMIELSNSVGVKKVARITGEHGLIFLNEMDVDGKRLAFIHPGIGAPLAGGILEEVVARGCRKFIVCGGAGVLDKGVAYGHLVVPTSAIRDEGTSYHYLPPAREVAASPAGIKAIERTLKRRKVPYIVSKTWTTDAFFRETPAKIALRKSEGCLTVEMEAAALFAVARFRKVHLAQILYGGDDVSGAEWDTRRCNERDSIRKKIFWLAVEACLSM